MKFNKIKEESRNICPAEDNEIDKLFSQKCFCIAGGSNPEKLYEKILLNKIKWRPFRFSSGNGVSGYSAHGKDEPFDEVRFFEDFAAFISDESRRSQQCDYHLYVTLVIEWRSF